MTISITAIRYISLKISASLKIFEGFLWHRYFDLVVPTSSPPKFLWHKTTKSDADYQHRPGLFRRVLGPGDD